MRLAKVSRRGWLLVAAIAALAVIMTTTTLFSAKTREAAPKPQPPGLSYIEHFDSGDLNRRGWRVDQSGGDVALSTDKPYAGRAALRMESSGSSTLLVSRAIGGIKSGHRYDVGVYALPTAGRQLARIVFLDASGRELDRSESTTPRTDTWSRVVVSGVAPQNAVRANLQLMSSSGGRSLVSWDELRMVESFMPNGDLEAWNGDVPLGWDVSGLGGSGPRRSDLSHGGRYSLRLAEGTGDGWATSPEQPVLSDAEYIGSFWHRATRAGVVVRTTWYDAGMKVIRAGTRPVPAGAGGWTQYRFREAAPDGAAYLSLSFRVQGSDDAEMMVDDLSAAPSAGSGDAVFAERQVARLDGFLTTTTFEAVKSGGSTKFVTIVSGEPATLQMADLDSGRLQYVERLPDLTNGWAMTTSTAGDLIYLGGGQGQLYAFDPAKKSLTNLGRATPNATLIWDIVTGPDGRVWGASYPKGEVWNYDPETQHFTSLGSASPGSDYGRSIAVDRDNVYVGTGPTDPTIVVIPIDSPNDRSSISPPEKFPHGFIYKLALQNGALAARFPTDQYGVYDLRSRQWRNIAELSSDVGQQFPVLGAADQPFMFVGGGRLWTLAGEKLAAVAGVPGVKAPRQGRIVRTTVGGRSGMWMIGYDGGYRVTWTQLPESLSSGSGSKTLNSSGRKLELQRATLRIKSLATGDDGLIYVGGFGGPSLSAFTLQGRQVTRYPREGETGEGVIGEIEGMIGHGRYQYLGSYTGARILQFDTSRPWNDESNPRQVASLGVSMEQDRPVAWATSGDRVYFGTVPKYGVLTGALGWIDQDEPRATSVRSPVENQSVVSLAARGRIVYAGTSRWGGLGIEPSTSSPRIFAYDSDRKRVLWSAAQPAAEAVSSMFLNKAGQLWAVAGSDLIQVDPSTGVTIRRLHLQTRISRSGPVWAATQMTELNGLLVLAAFGGLYTIEPGTLRVTAIERSGVAPGKVVASNDTLFFPTDTRLMAATPRRQ